MKSVCNIARDKYFHAITSNLQKIPGHIYYLYENENNFQHFISIISPNEWGISFNHKFIGAFHFNTDQNWISISDKKINH